MLSNYYRILVAKVPMFKEQASQVTNHIQHKYSLEMSKSSVTVVVSRHSVQ